MPSLRLGLVAGEASGDSLGAHLIEALRARGVALELFGVGGPAMAAQGLKSLFDYHDLAVMGFGPVIRRLPLLLRRIRETADFMLAQRPDLLLTIDSPDFSKRVQRRVRRADTGIANAHWVCPSVWAWRPGRARKMAAYLDNILCLLPFEPEALARLSGPPGVYVGHPLIERLDELRPQNGDEVAARARQAAPELLLLPGSRQDEVRRLLPVFLAALARPELVGARVVLPTLPRLVAPIQAQLGAAAGRVVLVTGEAAKLAAFRRARAALAASGTVTLELALAGIPTVAAYLVADWEAFILKRMIKLPSVLLPNIILGEKAVPEFLQAEAEPAALAQALAPLLGESAAREAQIVAFARLEAMMLPGSVTPGARVTPSARAAEAVLQLAGT